MMKFNSKDIEKNIIRKNRIKNIMRIMAYFVIIPLIFYNVTLIIQSFIKKDEIPSFFGYKTFVIVSGSMEPNLNIGDIIIVKKENIENINQGDIISFREGSVVVTHRVNKIIEENGEKLFETKGDNNNVADRESISYSQIEGKFVTRIEKLGNLALALKNKIVIITVLLILVFIYSHNMKVEKRRLIRLEKRQKYEIEREKNEQSK